MLFVFVYFATFIFTVDSAEPQLLAKLLCGVPELEEEILSYEPVVKRIINYVVDGDYKGKTFQGLTDFVDTFGARPSGSQTLEDSIDYMIQLTRDEGINDIITEEVMVPQWTRYGEEIMMLEPRLKPIAVLGLGRSIGTPLDGITAEVIVVKSFTELESHPDNDIEGKIVLFDQIFTTYGETVEYRTNGPSRAAAKGAVACLIRSITPFSINSPHTGTLSYDKNVREIPGAAITLEDADLIRRLYSKGEKVVLKMKLFSTSSTSYSRNTIINYEGTTVPEQLVIVSGHIDSWDVGQGAMDDGGGMFISWAVPIILKNLNLTPKRTIRTIFWTAEELGLIGAIEYEKRHKNESKSINFIMESDEGTFAPLGLVVAGNNQARCVIREILKLFKFINASTLIESDTAGSDISVIIDSGVPGASLYNDNKKYWWFHHTEGDTMNVLDQHELDLGAAFWTAVAYIIADISIDIPRN